MATSILSKLDFFNIFPRQQKTFFTWQTFKALMYFASPKSVLYLEKTCLQMF